MSAPRLQPGISSIVPYKGGESTVDGVERIIKLSSNESPLGPSPKAVAAYPGYEDYAARSKGREIPLVILEPR